jgi:hypothetical protein
VSPIERDRIIFYIDRWIEILENVPVQNTTMKEVIFEKKILDPVCHFIETNLTSKVKEWQYIY